MSNVFDVLTIIQALGKTTMIIMVGIYFIFSNTIMKALRRTRNGAEIMVDINQVILNPVFMTCFIFSGISSLWFALTASGTLALGGAVFFAGTTLLTMIKNVPLNNKLRDTTKPELRQRVWQQYLSVWVFWNHIRSISAVLSGFLLVL